MKSESCPVGLVSLSSVVMALGLVMTSGLAFGVERKVLIVGIDGMRADCLIAANTPNIDAIIADGAVDWTCQAEDITISGPCWSSILTGVHRAKHLVTGNSFVPNDYQHYPHLYSRIREQCSTVRTASIVHWTPVNTQILQGNADLILSGLTDDQVRDACVTAVSQDAADVIFLHFDDVDHAGHGFGFSPTVPEYIATIEATDARVGAVMAAIQARPTYANEDWLVIVVSDHGGSGTSHGANIPEHRTVALVVSGDSTDSGTTIPTPTTIADVSPTVMAFLGLTVDPAWGWDGQAVGLDLANSPSVPLSCPSIVPLFFEGFEAVPLGPSVNEPVAQGVWSGTPPIGWSVDDTGVPGFNDPNVGVTEWEGWAFTNNDWWVSVAADQNRSQFTRGLGAIAVADPDEWDDRGAPSALGTYNAHLITPEISLAGVRPGSVRVEFDSSWRFEGLQRAELTARFDGGSPVTLLDWRSQAGTNFKPDATNEAVAITVDNPQGASSMILDFALLDAGNNWWWAIDNLQVFGEASLCVADVDDGSTSGTPDGGVTIDDLLFYLLIFNLGATRADIDNGTSTGIPDGGVTIDDLLYFISRFNAGC
ncbi:MAG: alkaline phosphatase family protein [Phycisphaerales bacterium]|nr:MAG: alkaline phosphatase family protein [Phycisphaerales bacterium]